MNLPIPRFSNSVSSFHTIRRLIISRSIFNTMFKQVVLLLVASVLIFNEQIVCRDLLSSIRSANNFAGRVIRQAEPVYQPSPYSFDISSVDENGTQVVRQENGDGAGKVTGSYTYQNPITGLYRVVSYVADENGFNARVETNEPGTISSNPANVEVISSAPQRRR